MKFMQFMQSAALRLLAASDGAGENVVNKTWEAFQKVFNTVMPVLLGVVGLFGIIYCIVLGVNYAKAEDTNAREEAKKRFVGAIVGIVVAAILMAIIWIVLGSGALSGLFKADSGTVKTQSVQIKFYLIFKGHDCGLFCVLIKMCGKGEKGAEAYADKKVQPHFNSQL